MNIDLLEQLAKPDVSAFTNDSGTGSMLKYNRSTAMYDYQGLVHFSDISALLKEGLIEVIGMRPNSRSYWGITSNGRAFLKDWRRNPVMAVYNHQYRCCRMYIPEGTTSQSGYKAYDDRLADFVIEHSLPAKIKEIRDSEYYNSQRQYSVRDYLLYRMAKLKTEPVSPVFEVKS